METNIHYPTNNSLTWDCFKTSCRYLSQLQEEAAGFEHKDFRKKGKQAYFQINVTKSLDQRARLFQEQLERFMACINQVMDIVKKRGSYPGEPAVLGVCKPFGGAFITDGAGIPDELPEGNPKGSQLYQEAIDKVIREYGIIPGSVVTDGGYGSLDNLRYREGVGIENIVFGKVVGSLQNTVSSKRMKTMLKMWRSGIEAVISNFKEGISTGEVYLEGG